VNGERGMRALLAQAPDIDAVFLEQRSDCSGRHGHRTPIGPALPQELAIVGFDNTPRQPLLAPLTTIYQQLIDVGRMQ